MIDSYKLYHLVSTNNNYDALLVAKKQAFIMYTLLILQYVKTSEYLVIKLLATRGHSSVDCFYGFKVMWMTGEPLKKWS